MPDFLFQPTPAQEAIDFLKSKPALPRAVFDELLPELKARAFTVTGIEMANVLQSVRDRIADLPAGGDWQEIKRDIVREISPFFVTAIDADERAREEAAAVKRAEILIRMHGFQAYAAGNFRVMDRQRDVFPFWQYLTMEDERVRASHAALEGVVLPAGSEFWQTHFPPWDFGCRCRVVPLSEDDALEFAAADRLKPIEERNFMEGALLEQVEQRRQIVRGPNQIIDLRAPTEKGKPGAYQWNPGDLRLDLAALKARYDAPVWAAFEKWAGQTPIPEFKQTVLEWLSGSPLVPATAPTTLPAGVAPRTFSEILAELGLDRKVAWAPADVTAILARLKKAGAVKVAAKLKGVTGNGLQQSGPLSAAGVKQAMQEVLDLLPPAVAQSLPEISIQVLRSIPGSRGDYSASSKVLRLSVAALGGGSEEEQRETIWHELMHWIHMHGPQAYRAAIAAHFAARTQGERQISLPGYGSAGKRDKWWDAYAGRIYPFLGETGTEVPTRYFQLFAHPQKFVHQLNPGINANAGHFLETLRIVMSIFE